MMLKVKTRTRMGEKLKETNPVLNNDPEKSEK
jgi:hypothetical protein